MQSFPQRLGLTFGSFAAVVHLVWAVLVAAGTAPQVVAWVMGIHFVTAEKEFVPFSLGTATVLIIAAFMVAYVAGWVIGNIWEKVNKMK